MSETYAMTKDNKGKVDLALDFPRLRLEKKGERARLAIFGIAEDKLVTAVPVGGYYFDLRVPGAEREYVGSYECLAPEETKAAGEFDADACPHCEVALKGETSEEVMRPRARKFVMPVVRYATQPGTSELVTPYSVEVKAWRFGDRYFNVLVDENLKWESTKGLLGHDLTLTCEVVNYQNFTISVEPNAAYAEEKDTLGKLVIGTFIAQTAPLTEGLGRQLGRTMNKVDLHTRIEETLAQAAQLGIGAPVEVQTVDPATIDGLAASLLGEGAAEAAEEALADVVSTTSVDVTAEPEVPVPTAEGSDDEEANFDDFFSGGS